MLVCTLCKTNKKQEIQNDNKERLRNELPLNIFLFLFFVNGSNPFIKWMMIIIYYYNIIPNTYLYLFNLYR